MRDPRTRLLAYLLVISACWGSGFLFIKIAAQTLPPFAIATARGFISASAILLWFILARRAFMPDRRHVRHMIVLGAVNGWIPNAMTAMAITRIDSALAAMIQASSPLIVALLSHVFLAEERMNARRALGITIGLGGIFLLVGPAALLDAGGTAIGGALMIAVSISYASGTVYVRRVRPRDNAAVALGQQISSMLPALALCLAFEPIPAWDQPALVWGALLGVGVIASAIPMAMFLQLLRFAEATQAASVGYLMPIWAAGFGVILLGERLASTTLLAAAIVLTGVWLVASPGKRQSS